MAAGVLEKTWKEDELKKSKKIARAELKISEIIREELETLANSYINKVCLVFFLNFCFATFRNRLLKS